MFVSEVGTRPGSLSTRWRSFEEVCLTLIARAGKKDTWHCLCRSEENDQSRGQSKVEG